jgi:hypothetical protein
MSSRPLFTDYLIGQLTGVIDLPQCLNDCLRIDGDRSGLNVSVSEVEHQ